MCGGWLSCWFSKSSCLLSFLACFSFRAIFIRLFVTVVFGEGDRAHVPRITTEVRDHASRYRSLPVGKSEAPTTIFQCIDDFAILCIKTSVWTLPVSHVGRMIRQGTKSVRCTLLIDVAEVFITSPGKHQRRQDQRRQCAVIPPATATKRAAPSLWRHSWRYTDTMYTCADKTWIVLLHNLPGKPRFVPCKRSLMIDEHPHTRLGNVTADGISSRFT
ncbi:hypothetical protein EDD16DRAFT_1595431 [Pisolithus croceorrhizus]|nr:hypothetical protein EDD16DRAFT_1595431 [Pisolithus croceorrhizus]KAI6156102.1 hypothetical protein EDD17DRAFT_1628119 [Pisolithus thermaeus]